MTLTTRPTLNINALRRTQLSIMDETKPFCMTYWNTCIHGHACDVLGLQSWAYLVNKTAIALLGLTADEVGHLFVETAAQTRMEAVLAIDSLIASRQLMAPQEPEPQPEPDPAPPQSEPRPLESLPDLVAV